MLEINNQYTFIKRQVQTEVLKAFFADGFEQKIDAIPFAIIPKERISSRCCIYKERAMVRYRIMAMMGVDIPSEDDELKSLGAFAASQKGRSLQGEPVLTTIPTACSACPKERYFVSAACRQCIARPCLTNCPKTCITFDQGQAEIDEECCIRCGKCMGVCPFGAIVHVPVPCESACPVDAVHKNEHGYVELDKEKCISCGKCAANCPFGAIVERSEMMEIALYLKEEVPTVALIAPSIEGQFPGTLSQISKALLEAGFSAVLEVAQGAETTSYHEAEELLQKKEFMTTSCCPAYTALVDKHLPQLSGHLSTALSPMAYTGQQARQKYPQAKNVFIGPCLAKRSEAAHLAEIDAVMTFSELAALFLAKDIDVREMEECEEEQKAELDRLSPVCPQWRGGGLCE
ncbi:MAG: [Fe-Fe] hydrogenase large subunit C-terminal domain-containing protein [Sphaerochaetaceae bacterium]